MVSGYIGRFRHPLIEQYCFSFQSIQYLHDLIGPDTGNVTQRAHALLPEQSNFLYNITDGERISETTVCITGKKACLALKRLL